MRCEKGEGNYWCGMRRKSTQKNCLIAEDQVRKLGGKSQFSLRQPAQQNRQGQIHDAGPSWTVPCLPLGSGSALLAG